MKRSLSSSRNNILMGVAFPIVSMAGVGAINALLVVLAFVLDAWTNLPNKKVGMMKR